MDISLTVRGSGPLAGFEAKVVSAELDDESDDGIRLTLDRPYTLGGSVLTAVVLPSNGLLLTPVGGVDLIYVPKEQLLLLAKLNNQLLGREA